MNIELKIKPLSVNEAWQGKRFKTVKYKRFERDVLLMLPKTKEVFSDMIRIDLFFGFSSILSDLDNPIKMTLDILQKKYGFNDRNIFELNVRKCKTEKGKEFISINIENLLPFDLDNQK
jgi:Holliday junction resolvase RusA-like endonuclease